MESSIFREETDEVVSIDFHTVCYFIAFLTHAKNEKGEVKGRCRQGGQKYRRECESVRRPRLPLKMQGELPRKRVRGFGVTGLLDFGFSAESQSSILQSPAGDSSLCTREPKEHRRKCESARNRKDSSLALRMTGRETHFFILSF